MISGTLSLDDFIAANRLHRRSVARKFVALLVLISAISLAALAVNYSLTAVAALGGSLGGLAGEFFTTHVVLPRRCRRLFAQNAALRGTTTYSWTEQALQCSGEIGSSRIAWRDYRKYREDDRQFLVYVADNQFQMVPKAWFDNAAQADEFRRLARLAGTAA